MRRPWILSCAILAGCAAYQAKPIDPVQLAQRFEGRTLATDGLRRHLALQLGRAIEPWPATHWNLELLTLAAEYYSPALALARAQWETSRAAIAVAGARSNPVFQLPFEYTTNHEGAGRPVTTGPAFDIPVETADKREGRVEQATYLSEAARLHVLDEAWRVRSAVRGALVDMYAETKRSVMLAEKAGLQQQIVDMLRRRESAGETARPDVIRAELLLTQVQAELSTAQRALLDARARLAIAVGLPISALDAVRLDFDEFERTGMAPPPTEARRAAIFHRADLQGALAEYEASQASLQLEVAKQYPDIHIGLGYSYDVGANKISLGLAGVTLPLLDRNQGAIAQAQARREETAARTAALQDGIINDLEHALTGYSAGQDAVRLSTARQALASRQMAGQTASFAAGATDRLALLQAKSDHQASMIEQLNEWAAMQQAAGRLEDAMQLPLSPNSTGISKPERETAR